MCGITLNITKLLLIIIINKMHENNYNVKLTEGNFRLAFYISSTFHISKVIKIVNVNFFLFLSL